MTQNSTPDGTGLPPSELKVAQYGFWIFRLLHSKNRALKLFDRKTKCILERIEPFTEEALNRQVKIERIPGIEEVSTNWSVAMTLKHLNDVNSGMLGVIKTLANTPKGQRPNLPHVEIAAFKPDPNQSKEIIAEFKSFSEQFQKEANTLPISSSGAKHSHPWFGPLSAHGWLCLAALHQGIHSTQIKLIERGL